MKKLAFFSLIVGIILFFGCSSKKYHTEKKKDHLLIKNNIKDNLDIKQFHLLDEKSFPSEKRLHLYLHAANEDMLGTIINKNSDRYLILVDKKLNIVEEKKLKKGRGPGEVGNWLPGMGMSNEQLYILDNRKNSIEIFNMNLEYEDTCQINSSDFRMNFGFTDINSVDDSFVLAPVISLSEDIIGAKINKKGKLLGYIEGEKPSGQIEHFSIKNLARYTKGPDKKLYMVMIGYKNKYLIRKYDKNLNLLWENEINDGLQQILSPEIVRFKDGSFELQGGRACSNIDVDEENIYVLRGVGGINKFEWKDNRKVRHHKDIKPINCGFVDVFDKKSGKFKYRIKGEFLNTKQDYSLYVIDNKFYFISPYSNKYKYSNKIITADVE
ncbi:MAG: hypothetical protein FXF47_05030 [Candidatus Mcinerneyibacterium aminivorans]|uniref:6-bladed beta-propeller n=1 Tax=Candidatus Mcinerneyibacterium aminivorans TaxID=2703815 RepID=A0A5D0MIC1_9BACT|nr:MAG: hypothetical protein FXF47_05030 [Candidatus Mcinerneyibacterium aminivorans]